MSYCVNCGVELEASLKECPLCHTPVINPNQIGQPTPPSPYPMNKGQVEVVKRKDLGHFTLCGPDCNQCHLPAVESVIFQQFAVVSSCDWNLYLPVCFHLSGSILQQDTRLYFPAGGRRIGGCLSVYDRISDAIGYLVLAVGASDCRAGHCFDGDFYFPCTQISLHHPVRGSLPVHRDPPVLCGVGTFHPSYAS